MKLFEALEIVNRPLPEDAPEFRVFLATGFTPLHLKTLAAAHLAARLPGRRVTVAEGIFGDLPANVQRLAAGTYDCGLVVIEWSDLEPTLGCRRLGGWAPGSLLRMEAEAAQRLELLAGRIETAGEAGPVFVALPSLPLPPVSFTTTAQAPGFELRLREAVARFAARISAMPGVTLVNEQRLAADSPMAGRYNLSSDLTTGFPYSAPHADALAGLLATLAAPHPAKKGLITDLDDTLWRGILGEVGIDGVSWDLDHHTQAHGLYQQMLDSLAQAGVLVAIASKNDAAAVDQALGRPDLLVSKERIFPVEAHWRPKSESVGRILEAWNIGADSVVFIDDSPMELAEVAAAYPGVECIPFPKSDPAALYALLSRLRDLFGKPRTSEEDAVRLESLRQAAGTRETTGAVAHDSSEFLRGAEAVLTFSFQKPPEARALELVNKTNQFNLNGRRFGEAEWRRFAAAPESFVMLAAYRDRYGPLGKISVMAGRVEAGEAAIDVWVLSCRAFSRRIEHRSLREIFERFGVARVRLAFTPTPKNSPVREFLAEIAGAAEEGEIVLTREAFESACPELFHQVEETAAV